VPDPAIIAALLALAAYGQAKRQERQRPQSPPAGNSPHRH
jgi:hypothetical protein